jgi:hypothetical protein
MAPGDESGTQLDVVLGSDALRVVAESVQCGEHKAVEHAAVCRLTGPVSARRFLSRSPNDARQRIVAARRPDKFGASRQYS